MKYNSNFLIPSELVDDELSRFGSDHDGGYIFPKKIIENSSLLISLGIKDDWSFEKDYLNLGNKKILAFDLVTDLNFFLKCSVVHLLNLNFKKSYKFLKHALNFTLFFKLKSNVMFYKKGISNDKKGFIKLRDILNRRNVYNGLVLSIDIEGDEYSIANDLVDFSSKIDSVSLEFHNILNKETLFYNTIEKLKSKYEIVHIHYNNYSQFDEYKQISDCIELTFVNKKFKMSPLYEFKIPSILDSPCNPDKDDYQVLLKKP